MLLGVPVEARGVGVEQSADVRRLLHIVARHRRARAEQMDDEIGLGAIRAVDRAQSPARHRQHFLEAINDCGMLSPSRSGGGRLSVSQASHHRMDELVLQGTGDFRMRNHIRRGNGKLSCG